jgi:ketosteroid isomerase-like protein
MRATLPGYVCAAISAITVVVAACDSGTDAPNGGGDADDVAEIEQLVRDNFAAVEARDFDKVYDQSTSEALAENYPDVTDRSREGYRREFERIAADRGDTRQPFHDLYDITVEGDHGAATVETWLEYDGSDPASQMIAAGRWQFRNSGGEWKIDQGFAWTSPRIRDGVPVVDVDASEFAFALDAAQIRSGNIALRMRNAGEQVHQLTLQRVPADLSIEAWIRGFDEPSGEVSEIGGSVPLDPGESRNLTFTAPLAPGRYVMLCFITDTNDAVQSLHTEKGMWAEFVVPN